ncbi:MULTISPECIES: hypothetical protein [unclassified Microbispora]|uniref:hypothetical protein n=1 Tax=unclassified Microbispora TaxID=2614687 RepID=UPI001601A0C0|nr:MULTISPECIES: hypothetical protein [unclassified Microbispora]
MRTMTRAFGLVLAAAVTALLASATPANALVDGYTHDSPEPPVCTSGKIGSNRQYTHCNYTRYFAVFRSGASYYEAAQKINPELSDIIRFLDEADGCGAVLLTSSNTYLHFPTNAAASDEFQWFQGDPEYGVETIAKVSQTCMWITEGS